MRAPRLLLITDPDAPGGLVAPIERALAGGAFPDLAVQVRAKSASARALYEAAVALRRVTRDAGARLVVNGRVDVALAAEADGVHLPERGLPASAVRALMPDALVGVSCHDAAGLVRAGAEGADYAVLGPIGPVPGKGPPLGIEGFRALVAARGPEGALPVLALGGIVEGDVPALLEAGAHGIAVIRGVVRAPDPAAATRALIRALDTGARDAR